MWSTGICFITMCDRCYNWITIDINIFIHVLKCKCVLYFDDVVNVVIEVREKGYFDMECFDPFSLYNCENSFNNEHYKYMEVHVSNR